MFCVPCGSMRIVSCDLISLFIHIYFQSRQYLCICCIFFPHSRFIWPLYRIPVHETRKPNIKINSSNPDGTARSGSYSKKQKPNKYRDLYDPCGPGFQSGSERSVYCCPTDVRKKKKITSKVPRYFLAGLEKSMVK